MTNLEYIDGLFMEHYVKDRGALQIKSDLNRLRFKRQVLRCSNLLPQKAKVLEAGCGCGYVMSLLHELRPDLKLQGTDIKASSTWQMLKEKGFKLQTDDMTNSKFKENTFDAIISFGVMEHTKDEDAFVDEMYRVLKPGGLCLVFNLPNQYAMNDYLARKFNLGGHEFRYDKQLIEMVFNEFEHVQTYRECLIPAQVNLFSKTLNNMFNKYHKQIDAMDRMLMKTPCGWFAQAYYIRCYKGDGGE